MRTSRAPFVLAVLALGLAASPLPAGEPPAAAGVALSLRFEPAEHRIAGEAVLRMPQALPELVFRLHANLKVTEARAAGVETALTPATGPVQQDPFLTEVRLALPAGATSDTFTIRYEGTLYDAVRKDENLSFVIGDDTRGVVGTEGVFLVNSSGFYPLVEPLCRFDRIVLDVPDPFRAVTQGGLVSREVRDGREITTWTSTIPVDGLALQAGEYVVDTRDVDGVAVSTYFFAKDREHAKFVLDQTERYLRFYTPLLGPYPWPKFDIVENFFTTGYGMPSYTLLGADVVQVMVRMAPRYGGNLPPGFVDHELVHCWWGNYVYPDYATGNWCEGLTSYCSNYLAKEKESTAEAVAHRKRTCTNFAIRANDVNDYPVRAFRGKTEEVDNDIGYGKSSMIFHMARRLAGDAAFFGGLRQIVKDFGGRAATWEDFAAAIGDAAGQDLSAFFAQWLDRKSAPRLSAGPVSVTRDEQGRFLVKAEVRQEGEPWTLRVPVRAEWAEGHDEKLVDLSGPSASVEFTLTRPPVRVSVDPEFEVFRLVPRAEIQPCLNLLLESREKVYVVPDGHAGYRRLAEMAVARKGGEIVSPAAGLPATDCLLFGTPEQNPAVAEVLAGAGVKVEGSTVTIRGTKHEAADLWLLWSGRHPKDEKRFVTVFFGVSDKALEGGRAIYHYGWDGYVVYGGRPLGRGDTIEGTPATVAPVTLPADEGRVKEDIGFILDPRWKGRRAGTAEDVELRGALIARLAEAGAADVREIPFSVEVRDFADPDAWTVAQGEIAGGVTWKTAYPDAVVPAAFSPECMDGVRIRRIAAMPAEPVEGLLLMVPAETDAEALLAKVREAAAARPAAIGIPMEVLAGKDKRIADLAAFPSRLPKTEADPMRAAAGMQARAAEAAGDLATLGIPVVFVDARLLPPVLPAEADARLRVLFVVRAITTGNIVGVVPDRRGGTTGAAAALGAHFDGLGEGFAGADDNASGVAALLEAVRLLSARRDLLGSPVRVLLFGAEEWGLRGAAALVPELAPGLRALVNLDTVGARDVSEVFVIGQSAHPSLAAAARGFCASAGVPPGRDIDRFAFRQGSDHWPFHLAGVPSVDLFSGQYRRMNSADDVPDLLDHGKIARIAAAAALTAIDQAPEPPRAATTYEGEEAHLGNIRMLTQGGENAEAYFPPEDDRLVFQSKRGGFAADQIFLMDPDGSGLRMLSSGKGVTTCSYLFPGGKRVLYATTALSGDAPPPPPDYSRGYVWKLHPEYEIVAHDLDGKNFVRLTDTPGYDAEATISRDGQWIVFTSCRTGDPEIYRMRPDGSEVTRLTDAMGYDGGAFFSFDGSQIVWRANRPKGEDEEAKYRKLREHNEFSPTTLDLWVMNADGTNPRRITDNGAANFGPFFHPDGRRIIFSSNVGSKGRAGMPNFDLYLVNVDGTGLTRITTCPSFDGFPMFTADGKRLVFCSNRDNGGTSDTNVFIADWKD